MVQYVISAHVEEVLSGDVIETAYDSEQEAKDYLNDNRVNLPMGNWKIFKVTIEKT